MSTTQITSDQLPKQSFTTDGTRVYVTELKSGHNILSQVSAEGGETSEIPTPFSDFFLFDIAPNPSELLLGTFMGATSNLMPLWIVPVPTGSPRRLGDLRAEDAGWSPDGQHLRFTVVGANASQAFWQVATDGTDLHPLLKGWNNLPSECCGVWTPDGKYFVFQSGREVPFAARGENSSNIWIRAEKTSPFQRISRDPVQLTTGPLRYSSPLPINGGNKLLVIGEQPRGELVRYDAKFRQFEPFLSGISASQVDFSRDGEWVTYVTFPDNVLWRSRSDGSERQQLSYPPMEASLAYWSPDGTQIAFMGGRGRSTKVFLVSAAGGNPQELLPEQRTEADPTWSADGNSLSFGRFPFMEYGMSRDVNIQTVDLKTRQIYTVPGSDGLYSPRWSPDGRYLAALSSDSGKLMLFESATKQWSQLAEGSFAFPNWSYDGKYFYFEDSTHGYEVRRIQFPSRKFEFVAALKDLRRSNDLLGFWSAPAFDGSPLVMRNVGNQEIYALNPRLP